MARSLRSPDEALAKSGMSPRVEVVPHSATLHAGYVLISFLMPVRVGLGQHMAATGLVGPIFPGPPSLRRIRTIAAIAGVDLARAEVFDLAAQLLGAQQRACVARQVDRHPHHLDERATGRGKTVA